jgi:hypothetical protein
MNGRRTGITAGDQMDHRDDTPKPDPQPAEIYKSISQLQGRGRVVRESAADAWAIG